MNKSVLYKTLKSIKQHIGENGEISRWLPEGTIVKSIITFNEPTTSEKVKSFEEKWKLNFPEDYIEFLVSHNGGNMFSHPLYGGGIELLSLERIDELYKIYKNLLPNGWIPIALEEGDEMLLIDTNQCVRGNKESSYLYWSSLIDVRDEAISLKANFELWLDRFYISQGNKYWEWMQFSVERYYKYR